MAGERAYSSLTLFTIGLLNTTGEAFLGRMKNCSVSYRSENIEVRAGTNVRPSQLAGYTTETISGEAYMTTSNFRTFIGQLCGFTHTIGGNQEVGSGLLTSRTITWGTGDAEGESFELIVSGTPTLA